MELSDQELSIALKEFETPMADVSELFLPVLENRLDRTIAPKSLTNSSL